MCGVSRHLLRRATPPEHNTEAGRGSYFVAVTSALTDEHRDKLRTKGVSDEVLDGATRQPRYVSYEGRDRATVNAFAPHWSPERIPPASRPWASRVINETSGIVIVRRGLTDMTYEKELRFLAGHGPFLEREPLVAQLRPDKPVHQGKCRAGKTGSHEHCDTNKYLFPKAEWFPDGKFPMMIDVHPMARKPLKSGRGPVYFCLEGSINADAVLSHGEVAVSVPGVTMWRAKNLPEIAKQLEGREVYVVSDSDWQANGNVYREAKACTERLRELGALAFHAAPLLDNSDPKKGVGDMLADGGCLDDLEIVVTPPRQYVRLQALVVANVPRRHRAKALELVRLYGDELVFPTPQDKTLQRRLQDLERAGIVEKVAEPRHKAWYEDGQIQWASSSAMWRWL